MAEPKFTPEQTRILLQDEAAGKLPEEVKAELASLRDQQLFPPALGASTFQRGAAALKGAVRRLPPVEGTPSLQLPSNIPSPPGITGLGQQAVAELIPGNEAELGAMIGTGGAGMAVKGAAKLTGKAVSKLPAALARIFGSTAGGALGGAVTDEPGKGALVGAAGAATGEVASATGSALVRMLPGVRGKIARGEAATLAGQIGEATGTLKGKLVDTQDLFEAVHVPDKAKYLLGDAFEDSIQRMEHIIQRNTAGQVGFTGLRVPALGNQPMSLRQATEELKDLFHAGWGGGSPSSALSSGGKDPIRRTVGHFDERRTYEAARAQVKAELDRVDPTGNASEIFEQGRRQYAVGVALLGLMAEPGIFKPLVAKAGAREGVQLHMPALQKAFVKKWGQLKDTLPPQDFEALVQTLYSGAPIGSQDIRAPGTGRALDALRQVYGRGQGGAPQIIGSAIRTGLPGFGDEYVGRQPLSALDSIRTLADLLGIAGAGRYTEE